jgi:energy-coupling factor transporter ATP-binding protein EcfA2
MSDLWYKKLGFYSNPFNIKPAAFDDELVAYDLSFIHKMIDKGEMVFIEGEYGTGKTTILKNVIGHYKGKNRMIYYSFNNADEFNLDALLDGANTFWRKMAGLKMKDIILLLDEVQTMKTSDMKKLLKPYKDGIVKSVVFVSHDYELSKFPEEFSKLLAGNVIKTVNLATKEAIALVKRRIGSISLLPDNMIAKIFLISGKNPRRLLEYCEDVCRYAVELEDETVTDYHLNEVLGKVIKENKKDKEKKRKNIAKEEVKEIIEAKPVVAVEKKEKKKELPVIEEPYLEIKPLPEQQENNSKEKKFKINKLVGEDKKNSLGTIVENPEEKEKKEEKKEDNPEYKIYFLDNE